MSDLFAPAPSAPSAASGLPPARPDTPLLDAEKLHVYRLAVQFQALASRLVPRQRGELLATLRDQLDRASVSTALNIAEGAGRFSPPDKARFYSIARGSATECGAVLDLLLARRLLSESRHREARSLIVRIVQMLTRLSDRMTARHATRRDV
jgi:four helix bundle protein